jgi:hypothetical protein
MKRKNLKDHHLPEIPRNRQIPFLKKFNKSHRSHKNHLKNQLLRKKLEVKAKANTAKKLNS